MKKKIKIVVFLVLTVILLINIWVALLFMTKPPYYENFYGKTFRTAYSDTMLTLEEAIKDVDYFISEIKTYHPKPFLFMTEEAFDNKTDEMKIELSEKDEIKVGELFLKLSELAGMVDDSHTTVAPPVNSTECYLPFSIIYRGGKLYNISKKSSLPYKAEILSIDDIASEQLYDLIAKHSFTPLQSGTDRFVENKFRQYIPLEIGFKERYGVEYKINDRVYTKNVESLTSYSPKSLKQIDYYEFDFEGQSVPVLELNSFSNYGDMEKYNQTVSEFFEKYMDSETIIIDIRQNGGGSDDLGYSVFNHFANDTYKVIDNFTVAVNERVKAFYKFGYQFHLYQHRIPSAFWGLPLYGFFPEMEIPEKVLQTENGETLSIGEYVSENPIKAADRYKGKVYLLISGNTGSAGIDLASVFKYNFKNGAVIGQETKHPESFSGNISKYYLPYSGIAYYLPHSYSIAPGDKDLKRGVIPDYDKDRDSELEFVISELL